MQIMPDVSVLFHIINFLFLIWVLNAILYKPIRQILIKRKEKIGGLDQKIKTFTNDAEQKDLVYNAGLKTARAEGLKEKDVFLKAATEEERKIIEQINQKNQADFAEVQAKIQKDADAAKAALLQEVDVFAETISQKILGRVVS
jgi:F-type H+-transporting ATPase subunit b